MEENKKRKLQDTNIEKGQDFIVGKIKTTVKDFTENLVKAMLIDEFTPSDCIEALKSLDLGFFNVMEKLKQDKEIDHIFVLERDEDEPESFVNVQDTFVRCFHRDENGKWAELELKHCHDIHIEINLLKTKRDKETHWDPYHLPLAIFTLKSKKLDITKEQTLEWKNLDVHWAILDIMKQFVEAVFSKTDEAVDLTEYFEEFLETKKMNSIQFCRIIHKLNINFMSFKHVYQFVESYQQ